MLAQANITILGLRIIVYLKTFCFPSTVNMKLLYKKVLDYLLTKKDYFYKNLTLTGGLLDELLEKDIIDEVENVDIRGTDKGSRSEKIEHLIRIIMVKDDNTYALFKKCLLESHAFVVTKMEKKENKLNTRKYLLH